MATTMLRLSHLFNQEQKQSLGLEQRQSISWMPKKDMHFVIAAIVGTVTGLFLSERQKKVTASKNETETVNITNVGTSKQPSASIISFEYNELCIESIR